MAPEPKNRNRNLVMVTMKEAIITEKGESNAENREQVYVF
jgi:hypothetical protein